MIYDVMQDHGQGEEPLDRVKVAYRRLVDGKHRT